MTRDERIALYKKRVKDAERAYNAAQFKEERAARALGKAQDALEKLELGYPPSTFRDWPLP